MNVVWHLLGDRAKASARVRGYWVVDELEDGPDRHTVVLGDRKRDVLRLMLRTLRADAVVFQKRYSRWHVWAARWGRLLGKAMVLDLDDYPSVQARPVTLRNAERMMRVCSATAAGSDTLCEYAERFSPRVVLIPSCIKLDEYEPMSADVDRATRLGWIGNGKYYARDLVEILAPALREIASRHPLRLRIVGADGQVSLREVFGSIAGLELELIDQIEWSRPSATREALRGVDVGVYPLIDQGSNRYKCGFKGLEYMALGLPVVASPVSANATLFRDSVDGFLCRTHEQWVRAIESLVSDSTRRRAMGAAGRARIEAKFSTAHAAARWRELLGLTAEGVAVA